MKKEKTLEQLRAEKERAETQLAQEQHKFNRLENRKKYLEKGERTKRTHRHLPDWQKADRQDHLYRPCAFQPDRQGDDGGQNQASAP